jgi:hypothetical protein
MYVEWKIDPRCPHKLFGSLTHKGWDRIAVFVRATPMPYRSDNEQNAVMVGLIDGIENECFRKDRQK